MSQDNPYASPQVEDFAALTSEQDVGYRCWRDGDLLVVCRGAVLPDRCVKTDRTPDRHAQHAYFAFSYWYLILLPWPPFTFVVLFMIWWRCVDLRLPLTEEHYRPRQRARWKVLVMAAPATVAVIFVLVSTSVESKFPFMALNRPAGAIALVAGSMLLIAASAYHSAHATVLKRVRWMYGFVWLAGAHPDFLARLPEWGPPQAEQPGSHSVPKQT